MSSGQQICEIIAVGGCRSPRDLKAIGQIHACVDWYSSYWVQQIYKIITVGSYECRSSRDLSKSRHIHGQETSISRLFSNGVRESICPRNNSWWLWWMWSDVIGPLVLRASGVCRWNNWIGNWMHNSMQSGLLLLCGTTQGGQGWTLTSPCEEQEQERSDALLAGWGVLGALRRKL